MAICFYGLASHLSTFDNFCGKVILSLNSIPTRKETDHCVALRGAAIRMKRY